MTGNQMTRADHTQRASEAWALRVAGRTWQQIADDLGYNDASSAHRAVTRFRDQAPAIDGAEIRRELFERTEALWQEVWQQVVDREPGAARSAVAVLDRWAKLTGSDAPTRIGVGHIESMAEQMYATAEGDAPVTLPSMPVLAELMPPADG